jgi:hypothetical protein
MSHGVHREIRQLPHVHRCCVMSGHLSCNSRRATSSCGRSLETYSVRSIVARDVILSRMAIKRQRSLLKLTIVRTPAYDLRHRYNLLRINTDQAHNLQRSGSAVMSCMESVESLPDRVVDPPKEPPKRTADGQTWDAIVIGSGIGDMSAAGLQYGQTLAG